MICIIKVSFTFLFVFASIPTARIFNSARTITKQSTTSPATTPHAFKPDFTPAIAPCDVCSLRQKCVQPIQCPAHVSRAFKESIDNDIVICMLQNTKHGICCGTGYNHTIVENLNLNVTENRKKRSFLRKFTHHLRKLHKEERDRIEHEAHEKYLEMLRVEQSKLDTINFGEPEYMHNMLFKASHPTDQKRMHKITQQAVEVVIASQIYRNL